MKQCTIKDSVVIKGVGLHTGRQVCMTFKPAPIDFGYKFQRTDLEGSPIIAADANKVVSTNRGTTLKSENAQVSTVEHALSALVGLGIDNVLIEIDGPEVPIMDGSAMPFVTALENVGIVEQEALREYFEILEPISYRDEVTGTELLALPADNFSVTVMIDFHSSLLNHQYASLEHTPQYKDEIAACRTFVFLHELEQLLGQGWMWRSQRSEKPAGWASTLG